MLLEYFSPRVSLAIRPWCLTPCIIDILQKEVFMTCWPLYPWRYNLVFNNKPDLGVLSFLNCLENFSPSWGATDFLWHLSRVSKQEWIPSLACFAACVQWIPQNHLWCNTCWPLGSQHGSQTISSTYLRTRISRVQVQAQEVPLSSVCDKTDTLSTELRQPRWIFSLYFSRYLVSNRDKCILAQVCHFYLQGLYQLKIKVTIHFLQIWQNRFSWKTTIGRTDIYRINHWPTSTSLSTGHVF